MWVRVKGLGLLNLGDGSSSQVAEYGLGLRLLGLQSVGKVEVLLAV